MSEYCAHELGVPAKVCRPGQKADSEETQGWASLPVSMWTSVSQGGGAGVFAGASGVKCSDKLCMAAR